MSGLEVLGALASAVQLAETCFKITIFATDLFTQVRGAPATIRTRITQLEQFIEIAKLVEHNPTLQTPFIGSVLERCSEDASNLLDILKKLDAQATAGKVVKYWKALEGVTKESRIREICGRLEERKSSLALCIASVDSHLLGEINLQVVTVRQGIGDLAKELPAIRDTARKVTTIFDDLTVAATKISNFHDELPTISGQITAIHDDMPTIARKVTVIYDELPAIRDALDRLALYQQDHIVEPLFNSPNHSQSLLPFERDTDFVGREEAIIKINQMFSESRSHRRVALEGLGGVGKSQIAIEYAYRTREKSLDTKIFWVHAGTPARFEQSYRSIANVAKLPGADDPETDILSLVFGWLENDISGDWLMILDNADDPAIFFPRDASTTSHLSHSSGRAAALSAYLPKSRGSILITSRYKTVAFKLTGRKGRILKIENLKLEDATELIRKKLPDDPSSDGDWKMLTNALECLPLAITQAAAYIAMNSPRMTISKYLEYFSCDEANRISLLSKDGGDLRRDSEMPNAVMVTWQISFDQIKLQNAPAAALLSRMSLFDRQGIPKFLICGDDVNELDFEDAIGTLIGFSFIDSQLDGDTFEMHPLVQLSTRKWLEVHGEMEQRRAEVLSLLSLKFPTGEYVNWKICEILEPHAETVLRYNYTSQQGRLEKAAILHYSAYFALARGNYGVARRRIQEAINTREQLLGPTDPYTLGSHDLLASILSGQGRWKDAEELQVLVMETRKRVLGQEYPDTLTSMNNIATTYMDQGKWGKAEELCIHVTETRKRISGQEHPDTLASMSNLATTYSNQGKWEKAEELCVQVMEARKRILGHEHRNTLTSMNKLAMTYSNQGKWEKAEELCLQVTETRKRVLGREHPDTLISMNNIATLYMDQGRWKDAEELQVLVMRTSSRVKGHEHPDTLISMGNLALTWNSLDRSEEAVKLMSECVQISEKILGRDHPRTKDLLEKLNYLRRA